MTDRILLIYEMVPENTVVYLLPVNQFTEEELTKVLRCHGHFINQADQPEEAEVAMAWLAERLPELDQFRVYGTGGGHQEAVDVPFDKSIPVRHLVLTGFLM